MRKKLFFLSPLLLILLCSCVTIIPERFESSLKFLATYGYVEYNFRGSVLVAEAALDVRSGKRTQAETDKMLREVEQTILGDAGSAMGERQFRSLKYMGGNRFNADQQIKVSFVDGLGYFQSEDSMAFVEIAENAPPEDPRYFGDYTIKAFALDDEMRAKLEQLKVGRSGTFSIETDCRVLEHNAQSVTRSNRNYIYTWKIGSGRSAPPMLTLRAQTPRGAVN